MRAHCSENLIDCRARLEIDVRTPDRSCYRRDPASNHLQPAENNRCPVQRAQLPRAGAIVRGRAGRLYISDHAVERRYEPPSAASVARDGLALYVPGSCRIGTAVI